MSALSLEIKRLIVEALGLQDVRPEDIEDDAPLFYDGLGLDSIDALEIGLALRQRYKITLEGEAMREAFRSVATLCQLVERQRGAAE